MGISSSLTSPSVMVQKVSTQSGAVWTGTTGIPFDDTIPQKTEGDEYITLAITPKSATNKLCIEFTCTGASTIISTAFISALFQDTTAGALATSFHSSGAVNNNFNSVLRHTMVAGTTSATTFKIRVGGNTGYAGTITINGQAGGRNFGGVNASSLTITEYTP